MKAGVAYPQIELGSDTGASRRLRRRRKIWVMIISSSMTMCLAPLMPAGTEADRPV